MTPERKETLQAELDAYNKEIQGLQGQAAQKRALAHEIEWELSGIAEWLPLHRVVEQRWWSWGDSETTHLLDEEELISEEDLVKVYACDEYPRHIIEVRIDGTGDYNSGTETILYRLRQPEDPDQVQIEGGKDD